MDAVQKWVDDLELGWWHISLEWHREARNSSSSDPGDDANLDIRVAWEYCNALITAYLPRVADLTDEQLDYIVCHELMHMLTDEAMGASGKRKRKEHVATQLAQALIRLRRNAEDRGREREIERIVKQATAEDVEQWPLLSVVNGVDELCPQPDPNADPLDFFRSFVGKSAQGESDEQPE